MKKVLSFILVIVCLLSITFLMPGIPTAAANSTNFQWILAGNIPTSEAFLRVAISPNFSLDRTVFASLSRDATYNELYRSTDGGITWARITNVPSSGSISRIAFSPNFINDQTVFVSIYNHVGIYKSTDRGNNWTAINSGLGDQIQNFVVSPNFANDQTLFAGTNFNGLYRTQNGGSSWQSIGFFNNQCPDMFAMSPNFAIDETMFVGTSYPHFVYRSTDGGITWQTVSSGIHGPIVVSPNFSTDQTVFLGDMHSPGIFRSTDAGGSWQSIDNGIAGSIISSLEISPAYSTDNSIFAGVAITKGIFLSQDKGNTWTAVNQGLTPPYNSPYGSSLDVFSIAVSPSFSQDGLVFIGTGGAVYKSFITSASATIDLNPKTLNLKSNSDKNAFTAYIELPVGYDVSQINISSVKLSVNDTYVTAQVNPTSLGDYDGDNILDMMVKFDRKQVITALASQTGDITLTVIGKLNDNRAFSGSDTIKVISPGK
jgi:photosystem II stability/assembly factor-like uncharacterized protein